MKKQNNTRGISEHFIESTHLTLEKLQEQAKRCLSADEKKRKNYILKKLRDDYPRPEFQVSYLKHDTERGALCWIWKDGGFKDPKGCFGEPNKLPLVWWSLAVRSNDIRTAETRLVQKTYQRQSNNPKFLKRFANSPAFRNKSRLGSYRFTFRLEEVLKAYREQFCTNSEPVMRIFKTSLYKQEVVYTVLVHSLAHNDRFSHYPELPDENDLNAICAYNRRERIFIWRPEAMCAKQTECLFFNKGERKIETRAISRPNYSVWDHVVLALHVSGGQVLRFPSDKLRENLKFCEPDDVKITPDLYLDDFNHAERFVQSLWPDIPLEVEPEEHEVEPEEPEVEPEEPEVEPEEPEVEPEEPEEPEIELESSLEERLRTVTLNENPGE